MGRSFALSILMPIGIAAGLWLFREMTQEWVEILIGGFILITCSHRASRCATKNCRYGVRAGRFGCWCAQYHCWRGWAGTEYFAGGRFNAPEYRFDNSRLFLVIS